MTIAQIDEKAVFNAARRMGDDAARTAYLQSACGGDGEALQRILDLLRAYGQAESFLESPAGAAFSPTITDLPITEGPGTFIGPYKLLQQIGEGGMGVVYMAEQTEPVERRVALKIIKPGMDTRQIIARFEAERQALAMMDHPNIARVLDAGTTTSGRPYFVMELVRGVPITSYCDEHHLTPQERLLLFLPVCHAVQHAHLKGIIHRDLKPTNVLVAEYDNSPVPKVIDFGVAKATRRLTEKTLFTQFGQIVGTLEYMSPEQARLNELDIDTRSDVYSLGVLLYELLTGATPFDKDRLRSAAFDEVLRILREEDPPRPSMRLSTAEARASVAALRKMQPQKLSTLVRGDLDWIVMKALEKDRDRRYETASGFAMDVQRYLADEPVVACPPSATYRFRKFAKRNKTALATSLLLSTALIATVMILAVSNVVVTQERNDKDSALLEKVQALSEKEAALGAREVALTEARANYAEAKRQGEMARASAENAREQQQFAQRQEKLARRRLYAAQMNLAMHAWDQGHPARVLQLLESQRPRFDEEDLRGFDWSYLWQLCQGTFRYSLPTRNFDNASCVVISPDGKTLASGHGRTVRLWEVSSGRVVGEFLNHDNLVGWLAFAPDGRTLATSDESETVRLWDLATGQLRAALQAGQIVRDVQFTDDGRTLVLIGKSIQFWDVEANREITTFGESKIQANRVAVSPAGNLVVANGFGASAVRIWTKDESGWREAEPIIQGGHTPRVAISREADLLAIGSSSLRLYNLTTRQEIISLEGHTGHVYDVAFSGDGKRLASGGLDRTVRIWDTETGEQCACIATPGPVYGLAITADAAVVAARGADAIRVWDVSPPPPALVLRHPAPVRAVAFSPDGKTVASFAQGAAKLWDTADGREIATVAAAHSRNDNRCNLAFSPDGSSLLTSGQTWRTLGIWFPTGQPQADFQSDGRMDRVVYSPDGALLAAASDNGAVGVWDLASQQRRHILTVIGGKKVTAVAFSPDGKTLAAAGQFGIVKLFDVESGLETNSLQSFELAVDYVLSVAFSPNGSKLATANSEGLVRLWDVATNQLDVSLTGHTDAVWSLAFLDDGKTLATASEDHTVRLWDVETGQERITLTGHKKGVTGVVFSARENLLATSSDDGTVRLWRGAVDRNARTARRETDIHDPHSPTASNELGDRLWQYGRTSEAEAAYRSSLARLETLVTACPDELVYQEELVRSLLSISVLLASEEGDSSEADQFCLRARELYRGLTADQQAATLFAFEDRQHKLYTGGHGTQVNRTLSQMIELVSEDDVGRLIVASQHLTGCTDVKLRNTTRAVEFARQAVTAASKRHSNWPATGVSPTRGTPLVAETAKDRSERARALAYLGVALECDGRQAEAEAPYREAVAQYRELSEEFPDNEWYRQERAYFSLALGHLLLATERYEEALEPCRTSVQVGERLAVDFLEHPHHAERLAWARSTLVSVLRALKRDDESAEELREQESFAR